MAKAEFFSNISNIIENNNDRLSYGISVTDFDKDGSYEFIVAGFGYSNLALSYKQGKLINTIQDPLFIDEDRRTIGVLHNAKKCDAYDIDYIKNDQITGPMCEARNSMPLEELNFGMGDIFIRLAN